MGDQSSGLSGQQPRVATPGGEWPPQRVVGGEPREPAMRGELDLVVDLVEALQRAETKVEFRRATLLAAELIPGDIANFAEVDLSGTSLITVSSDPRLEDPAVLATYLALRHENPAVTRWLGDGGHAPVAISRLVTEPEFRSTLLYREVFRNLGIVDQLLIPIAHAAAALSLSIGRAVWGFSDAELALAGQVQRIVVAACRQRTAHDAARAAFPVVSTLSTGHGEEVLVSDRYGDVRRPDGVASGIEEPLLSAIRDAVRLAVAGPKGSAPDRPLVEITVPSANGVELHVRVLPPPDGCDDLPIMLERARRSFTSDDLARHGLTERQAEVMAMILNGATNGGVGNALGISSRTVEKHVHAAYQALGVRTRSEALLVLIR